MGFLIRWAFAFFVAGRDLQSNAMEFRPLGDRKLSKYAVRHRSGWTDFGDRLYHFPARDAAVHRDVRHAIWCWPLLELCFGCYLIKGSST